MVNMDMKTKAGPYPLEKFRFKNFEDS